VSSGRTVLVLAWVRDEGEFLPVPGASSVTAGPPILVLFQSLVRFLAVSFFLPFLFVLFLASSNRV
jgi:hypothetical protein